MYMFFWFFKQLYYLTRKAFKHGFLILFVFFVFFVMTFIYKGAFAFDITDNGQIITLPDLPFDTTEHPDFVITYNNGASDKYYQIGYPQTTPLGRFYRGTYSGDNTVMYTIGDTTTNGHWVYWNCARDLSSWGSQKVTSGYSLIWARPKYSTQPIYNAIDSNVVWFEATNDVEPYIMNETNTIVNWSFDYLDIYIPSDFTSSDTYTMRYTYPNTNTSYTDNVNTFFTNIDNQNVLHIPRLWFQDDIVIRSGNTFTFQLTIRNSNLQTFTYSLGSYTLSLTETEQNETNEDSNKQLLSDINTNQQQTNQKLDNIENTITDSTVSDDSIFLPTIDVQDPTQVGVNQVFDILYNSFTSGDDAEIVLPFPFTNQVIRIPGNYTYNFLHNNGGGALINIIRAFWWYKIASFIAYDVFSKVKVIQEGNIEDMQKDNIKGDML